MTKWTPRGEYQYVILPAFRQMRDDYYRFMGESIRGCVWMRGWLYRYRRTWYLALCGFLLCLALILAGLLAIMLQAGDQRAYHKGMADQFAMIAPQQCLGWWLGKDYDKARWRAREQLKKEK